MKQKSKMPTPRITGQKQAGPLAVMAMSGVRRGVGDTVCVTPHERAKAKAQNANGPQNARYQ
jgi:hypothetical protein